MGIDPHGPLNGVRVLDASRVLAGPFCGQMLGDLGAEVIKIERPGSGDETRSWGPPFVGDLSAYYLSCNRNKKAISLNLAQPDGLELFLQLAEKSDILLDNFRVHHADKLGVGTKQLHARNPKLIVCSITGFGRTGPMRDLPGYDFAIQALSGLMSITGPIDGPPSKVGVAVSDVLTGLYAAVAVLACLNARARSGHGYAIDLALLDCSLAAQVNVAQAFLSSGQVPARQGNAHLQIVPYQLFQTSDGWIVLAVGNDAQWQRFCKAVNRSDLAADTRFLGNEDRVRHRAELVPIVEYIMKGLTTAQWRELLLKADVPHAPVYDYADLFREPHITDRGMKITVRDLHGRPVDLLGSPFHIEGAQSVPPRMPPVIGQDNDQVLRDLLGLDAERIANLKSRGIV